MPFQEPLFYSSLYSYGLRRVNRQPAPHLFPKNRKSLNRLPLALREARNHIPLKDGESQQFARISSGQDGIILNRRLLAGPVRPRSPRPPQTAPSASCACQISSMPLCQSPLFGSALLRFRSALKAGTLRLIRLSSVLKRGVWPACRFPLLHRHHHGVVGSHAHDDGSAAAVRLNSRSKSPTTFMMSSKAGASPKNISPIAA